MFSAGFIIIIIGQLFPFIPAESWQLFMNLTELKSRLSKIIRKLQIHKTKHLHFIYKYEVLNSDPAPSPNGVSWILWL